MPTGRMISAAIRIAGSSTWIRHRTLHQATRLQTFWPRRKSGHRRASPRVAPRWTNDAALPIWHLAKPGVQLPYSATLPGTPVGWQLCRYRSTGGDACGLALKAITIVPAQIIGIDDGVGSLEAGKDATW